MYIACVSKNYKKYAGCLNPFENWFGKWEWEDDCEASVRMKAYNHVNTCIPICDTFGQTEECLSNVNLILD